MPFWERAPTPAIQCDQWMTTTEGVNLCLIVSLAFGITADEFLSLVRIPYEPPTCSICQSHVGLTGNGQNPVLNGECIFEAGKSYCVVVSTPGSPAADKSPPSSSVARPTPTSTTGPNGITTPLLTQAGMIKQCERFHLVNPDTECQDILDEYAISLRDFVQWNPAVGTTCTNMWAETYVCVGVGKGKDMGSQPTPSAPASPSTTLSPIHPGMVKGCKKFVL